MFFRDRREAGEKLAEALVKYKDSAETVVLGLPRGGVVVAAQISRRLNLPLDIVVPRKIGAPGNPEYAIGAITETGEAVLNEAETTMVSQDWLKKEMAKEKQEAERRLKTYRAGRPSQEIKGQTVILVDDGVATGWTMRAAIKSVKIKKPAKIIVAVPHGAAESLEILKKEADEVVALFVPDWYGAVGAFYRDFGQTSDEEVVELMEKSK